MCEIIGARQYSRDLIQGGLQIPCLYHFWHNNRRVIHRLCVVLQHIVMYTISLHTVTLFRLLAIHCLHCLFKLFTTFALYILIPQTQVISLAEELSSDGDSSSTIISLFSSSSSSSSVSESRSSNRLLSSSTLISVKFLVSPSILDFAAVATPVSYPVICLC